MGATLVTSVSQAMHIMESLGEDSVFCDVVYRAESRQAVVNVLQGRMSARVSAHLDLCAERGVKDRRNGSYPRRMLLGVGDVELRVPRTRRYTPAHILEAYARRAPEIDRLILAAFLLGLSTRKVGKALLALLGETVSASTVSQVAKQLDTEVAAWHRRPVADRYCVLMFDGVILSRKTGAGALKRPVLVALGVLPNGKKEVIDFRLAPAESQNAWEALLNDLYRRGLAGQNAKLVVADGGKGLLAALPLVYAHLPVQRCWVHKTRNVLDKVKKTDREAAKMALRAITTASGLAAARSAAQLFAESWQSIYPKAVHCLRADLDELLVHLSVFSAPKWRKTARSTNAIERCFVEVRRRTRPMGVMADRTSCDRILYAVFMGINQNQGTATPFPLTHNS